MRLTKAKWLFFAFFAATLFSGQAHAQVWSGILDPSRAVDWSLAGVPGGIPTRTTVCATIAPEGSAGTPVAATNIVNAIASCPTGQVVQLQAGYFYLNTGIDFNNHGVTLRGAGANQTFIISTSGNASSCSAFICIASGANSYPGGPNNVANWTAGYAKGTTQITLDSNTNITPGSTIITLDQCDSGFTANPCTGTATDTGNLWNCDTNNVCADESGTGNYRTHRGEEQTVLVTAVSGSGPYTVTISPGLYMSNWSSSETPGAWWATRVITGASVENMSIDLSHSSAAAEVSIYDGYGNWVSGIRGVMPQGAHVTVGESAHNTIQNSYFYGTANASSQSYGIDEEVFSDDLSVNNIFDHVACSVCADGPGEGSVYAYNFTWDGYYIVSMNWLAGGMGMHSEGTALILFEGNQTTSIGVDDFHGTHNLLTLFRNMSFGADPAAPYRTNNTLAVQDMTDSRYFNVVGNVLGTPGLTTIYSAAYPTTPDNRATVVYYAGWAENFSPVPPDPLSWETMMRWGNVDNVTGGVRWCGNSSNPGWSTTCASTSEVPTTLSVYSNAVPSSLTLPSSFYLSSGPPSWWTTNWGTPAWPPNGPDVTGGNVTNEAGYANNLPAELCYANSPVDTSYQTSTPITGATWAGGVATISIPAEVQPPEGYATFSGIIPSGYNGTFLLTSALTSGSTTALTFALATNPGTYVSSGALVYPYIKQFNAATCYYGGSPATPPAPAKNLLIQSSRLHRVEHTLAAFLHIGHSEHGTLSALAHP